MHNTSTYVVLYSSYNRGDFSAQTWRGFEMLLKKWLNKHEMSNRDFAKKAKIKESTLYNYLNLERAPTLIIAVKIVAITRNAVFYTDLIPTKERRKELKRIKEQSQVVKIFEDPDCF